MLNSHYRALAPVQLPYKGRQHYMRAINIAKPVMLEGFEDYLDPVQQLLHAAGQRLGTAYMTVDEKVIQPGMSQRRPGPHIDGRFMPELMDWSGGGGWNHYCNNVPAPRMNIIVASTVAGCRVWSGKFDGNPTEDGDCSHLAHQFDAGEIVPPNMGYLLSPDCVHESMVFQEPTQRTFLRIAY